MTRIPALDGGIVLGGCLDSTDLAANPVTAALSPPTDLAFDGQQQYFQATLASLTPAVTWSAPRLGTPTAYRVTVFKVVGPAPDLQVQLLARFLTTQRSLAMPTGVLTSGSSYAIKVTALQHGFLETSFPYRHGFPEASADGISGVLRAP
jgi:hypothetical protein